MLEIFSYDPVNLLYLNVVQYSNCIDVYFEHSANYRKHEFLLRGKKKSQKTILEHSVMFIRKIFTICSQRLYLPNF